MVDSAKEKRRQCIIDQVVKQVNIKKRDGSMQGFGFFIEGSDNPVNGWFHPCCAEFGNKGSAIEEAIFIRNYATEHWAQERSTIPSAKDQHVFNRQFIEFIFGEQSPWKKFLDRVLAWDIPAYVLIDNTKVNYHTIDFAFNYGFFIEDLTVSPKWVASFSKAYRMPGEHPHFVRMWSYFVKAGLHPTEALFALLLWSPAQRDEYTISACHVLAHSIFDYQVNPFEVFDMKEQNMDMSCQINFSLQTSGYHGCDKLFRLGVGRHRDVVGGDRLVAEMMKIVPREKPSANPFNKVLTERRRSKGSYSIDEAVKTTQGYLTFLEKKRNA